MRQKPTLVLLVMIAVTGAVTTPPSLSAAWRADVSARHVVDRGGSEWGSSIHTVADTGVRPNDSWPQNENYSTYGSQLGGSTSAWGEPKRWIRLREGVQVRLSH